ncbi:flagellar motor stator protein MotA [Candidatus Paracaedibacter symbiosus]|uniref:flagellar motor stator protein MotA n=1 Tax=Candidatus Paracaedibacter symbiosus TaxID=244582 RepID=UPI000509C485|nr:flagellar motor stator protein MotA [Candidatus Paracaedibacter symbiosus]
MMILIGMLVVISCVIGAYVAHGGHIFVLWQPAEFIIIVGAAIGAFIIGNTKYVLSHLGSSLKMALKGKAFDKADYLELLTLQFALFKLIKTKGMLELETHIETPKESKIFSNYPHFMEHHEAITFFCDYLRMLTMGSENVHQMEELMTQEIDIHHHERGLISTALQNMADSMPALGIVAAVLGVIHTMGSINQPPEVLGKLIGAALVGTFLGILLSYGFIGPLSNIVKSLYESEAQYFNCMKAGILACMNGYAPAIAVEYARKSIESEYRPDFYELEKAIATDSV